MKKEKCLTMTNEITLNSPNNDEDKWCMQIICKKMRVRKTQQKIIKKHKMWRKNWLIEEIIGMKCKILIKLWNKETKFDFKFPPSSDFNLSPISHVFAHYIH